MNNDKKLSCCHSPFVNYSKTTSGKIRMMWFFLFPHLDVQLCDLCIKIHHFQFDSFLNGLLSLQNNWFWDSEVNTLKSVCTGKGLILTHQMFFWPFSKVNSRWKQTLGIDKKESVFTITVWFLITREFHYWIPVVPSLLSDAVSKPTKELSVPRGNGKFLKDSFHTTFLLRLCWLICFFRIFRSRHILWLFCC